ncbi:hypothetical protein F5984_20455 [Rudanella paleaurantiibacter]|uniref:Uncharacterized protein n=1 Tax=Rudanella paleaurantiibacter TaxID=2614655 RepID=A0A7J5TVE0_9BACT|nr:hypothetical protein [Rudanella paleaurantiibacter]KAB7728120.1 hypothetical protein F5984_20455 [Rudanella paleaurantiibacter]
MIQITNQAGAHLELPPGAVLTFEQAVRWLGDGKTPGGFSYPISFPLNEANRRFLQHAYRPDTPEPTMSIPVSVQIGEVLHRRCTLSYRVQNGGGDGFLKLDGGEAADPLRSLSLRDAVGTDLVYLDEVLEGPRSLAEYLNKIATLAPSTFPLTFFPLKNDLFFEKELTNEQVPGLIRQPYVNMYGSGPQGPATFQTDAALQKGFPIVPFFFLTDILNRVFARIGYRPVGDWLADPEVLCYTIFNLTAIDAYRGRWEMGRFAVRVRDHLPDVSVSDFLRALRSRFGILFHFDSSNRTVSVRRWLDIISSPPQDLAGYQLAGYSIDEPAREGITLRDYIDDSDELYKNKEGNVTRPDPLLIGEGGKEEQLTLGTTQMVFEPRPAWNASTGQYITTSAYWLVPTVRQAGNIADDSYLKSERQPEKGLAWKNNVGLRLISYRGVQPDSGSVPYPLGTSGTINAKMDTIGALALELTGNRGAWRNGLRQYYYFRDRTQLLTIPLRWPAHAFSLFRFDAPVSLVLDQHRRTLLAERYQASASGVDGSLPTSLECLLLPTGISETQAGVDEEVWVELIVTPLTPIPVPGPNLVVTSRTYQKVEVRLWRNAARTLPSNAVIDLQLVRTQKSVGSGRPEAVDFAELLRIRVAGPGMLIDARYQSGEAAVSAFGKVFFQMRSWDVGASDAYKIIKPQ